MQTASLCSTTTPYVGTHAESGIWIEALALTAAGNLQSLLTDALDRHLEQEKQRLFTELFGNEDAGPGQRKPPPHLLEPEPAALRSDSPNDDKDDKDGEVGSTCRVAVVLDSGEEVLVLWTLANQPLMSRSTTASWIALKALTAGLSALNCPASLTCRVLFLNPTHACMVPCPEYLQGNCTGCVQSHGHRVLRQALRPFQAPDFAYVSFRFMLSHADPLH